MWLIDWLCHLVLSLYGSGFIFCFRELIIITEDMVVDTEIVACGLEWLLYIAHVNRQFGLIDWFNSLV